MQGLYWCVRSTKFRYAMQLTILKALWARLVNVGITPDTPAYEAKQVKFTNIVSVLGAIAIASYAPFSASKGYYVWSVLQLLDSLLILTAIYLNSRQRFVASKFMLIISVNTIILFNALTIGPIARIEDFFILSSVIPFMVFRVFEYRKLVTGILIAVVSFFIYHNTFEFFLPYNLDVAMQQLVNNVNMAMKFFLFAFTIYLLAKQNFTIEEELAISNDELKQQTTELKRSNEDLEQFAYIISHDLKAPIRNIKSFLNLLQSRHSNNLSDEAKELITYSSTSSDRLVKLIEDMLAYCKVGRNLPAIKPVDLNDVLKTIIMEQSERIFERRAIVSISKPLPVLENVHQGMIYHIFQNLVANGLKFNKSEKPVVTIGYKETNECYTFSVADNGIGISPENKDKLFHMFRRLHTSEQYEGTGIGLAICKKIVGFYKGEIWIDSFPGHGTTFYFTIAKQKATLKAQVNADPVLMPQVQPQPRQVAAAII
jgi:signal transduction histidine kinase